MKLTMETIRRLIKEEMRSSNEGERAPKKSGYFEYVKTDGKWIWRTLPRDDQTRGPDNEEVSDIEYRIQQKISKLASGGDIQVVEDYKENKIEFLYLSKGNLPTFYGSRDIDEVDLEEILEMAQLTKKETKSL